MAGTVRIDGGSRGTWVRRIWVTSVAVVALLALATPAEAKQQFGPVSGLSIPRERLFDLGVTDYNGDLALDLFTTNHKFHPALLRNEGGATFTEVTGATGLSPSPQFPGYETLRPPIMERSGVYIYATDSKKEKLPGLLHVRAVGVEAELSMSFGADSASVQSVEGGRDAQGRSAAGQPIIYFDLDAGGSADVRTSHLDLPVSVEFTRPRIPGSPGLPPILPPGPPSEGSLPPIYIGTNAVSAPADFILNLRDRHGYAWADVAGDPNPDLFAVSGGLGGAIKLPNYVTKVQDELLVQGDGSTFADSSAGSGLDKKGCRARQSAAVDVDGDGQLDLFETCEGEPPLTYLQTSRGEFRSIKSPRSNATTYRWAFLRGRNPVLLAAEKRGTRLLAYSRKRGWRTLQRVDVNARKGQVAQFALNDYDRDGDLDVLAVSRSGNTLLENRRGRLRERALKGTGIPSRSVAASFVDYDNDGRVDLDLVPQGLLQGTASGRFRGTGKLRTGRVGAGVINWADLDNDGLRDPIRITGNAVFAKRMKVSQSRNLGPGGHWLEVELNGKGGNREAIGAWVKVKAGNRAQYQWVGQNDDSHHSQGHYRLYFGLGRHQQASGVVVHWPDGSKTRLGTFVADKLIQINQP